MANHKSAVKRIRQTARRTAVNTARRSRVRTFIKKVDAAIEAGDKDAAQNALRAAQPELDRARSKGIFKKNTVARTLSRLSKKVSQI